MRTSPIGLAILIIGLCSAPSHAQTQEIVVTAERASGEDYSRMPAIVLERRADFLVQQVRLFNDTRAGLNRVNEIYQTIQDMIADAGRQTGIALSYGDDFLIPVTKHNYQVPLRAGGKPDTTTTELYVKMALNEKDDVQKSIDALRSFIKKARVSGRTEVEPNGDVGLSLVTPEKYRYDIITRITADAQRLQKAVAAQCKVEISGLSNRVFWTRSDISQLTLYIPYQIQLTGCQ